VAGHAEAAERRAHRHTRDERARRKARLFLARLRGTGQRDRGDDRFRRQGCRLQLHLEHARVDDNGAAGAELDSAELDLAAFAQHLGLQRQRRDRHRPHQIDGDARDAHRHRRRNGFGGPHHQRRRRRSVLHAGVPGTCGVRAGGDAVCLDAIDAVHSINPYFCWCSPDAALSAFTRVFDGLWRAALAAWCAAGPGSTTRVWVPALRSSVTRCTASGTRWIWNHSAGSTASSYSRLSRAISSAAGTTLPTLPTPWPLPQISFQAFGLARSPEASVPKLIFEASDSGRLSGSMPAATIDGFR